MRTPERHYWSLAALVLLLLPGCDKPTTQTDSQELAVGREVQDEENGDGGEPFEEAEVFFEFNTSANDMGFQLFLDAEGWNRLRVSDPGRNNLLQIAANGNLSDLGITELRFESAEPEPDKVLGLFPAGEYTFRGKTVEGDNLLSRVTLSHEFLPAFTFTPSNGQVVDPNNTVVQWNIADAEQVEVIIENDELESVFDVTLSGVSSLNVPPQFLVPGKEFKIELLAIAENGNRTIVESTFRTMP
jgi:hypothetical protein